MNDNEMELKIVDIVLHIPFDKWRYEPHSSGGRLQTLFKGKCIELSKTDNPYGTSYSTIHIDGYSFRDEGGYRCKIFYNNIKLYLDAISQSQNLDKVTAIYNQLIGINE